MRRTNTLENIELEEYSHDRYRLWLIVGNERVWVDLSSNSDGHPDRSLKRAWAEEQLGKSATDNSNQ
ncbi:MAG TPA: hypothetical protein VIT19_02080 [Pyrinomonadaceae bacterium]